MIIISEIIFLNIIMIVAIFQERKQGEINPLLWSIGGIIGLICNIAGLGICTWIESLLVLVATFVVGLFFSAKFPGAIGGGILKGLIMTAVYFGRYVLVTGITFAIGIFVVAKIMKKLFPDDSNSKILAMPIVLLSTVLTGVIIAFI